MLTAFSCSRKAGCESGREMDEAVMIRIPVSAEDASAQLGANRP